MYAVIATGGKQYRVTPGDVIDVETLPGEAGAQVEFVPVALFTDQLLTGPALAEVKVKATITLQDRAKKILVFKFKRKKQYKRTIGHRQNFTRLKVDGITGPGIELQTQEAVQEIPQEAQQPAEPVAVEA
jgi:large subunit ribosomal protein L21